jgi:uncharacterized membrane protein (DUF2068 family)
MNTPRPLTITIAAILLMLFSATSLIPESLPEGGPAIVIYAGYASAVLGIVAAVGLWLSKKWGMWLALVVSALTILSAAPGIVFAPTTTLWLLATVGVVLYAVIIALVLMPQSRRAYL